MRSLRLLICGFAGLACWSAAMLLAGQTLRREMQGAEDEITSVVVPQAPPVVEPVMEQKAVRLISPERFAAPFAEGDGSLERIAARPALTKADIKPAQPVRLARPQTIEAGVMIFDRRTLRLAGVIPTDRAKMCIDASGGKWPCGAMARTQQRLLLRNRSVDCDLASATWRGQAVASCEVGGIDMATWLAQNGWVEAEQSSPGAEQSSGRAEQSAAGVEASSTGDEPGSAGDEPGSTLELLTEQARAQRLGIFGDDPRQSAARP